MFEAGWVEEVRGLLASGLTVESPAMRSLGYGAIAAAILDGRKPEDSLERVTTETQQYAKRQETFFRSVTGAQWIDVSAVDPVETIAGLIRSHPDLKSHLT
jgi:tRNA dimethylallyltransferase